MTVRLLSPLGVPVVVSPEKAERLLKQSFTAPVDPDDTPSVEVRQPTRRRPASQQADSK